MQNHFPVQIRFVLLLLFALPSFGQSVDKMFGCGLRDKDGNLWFGTAWEGAYRFDVTTEKFTHFTTEDGLIDNHISSILEDKAGNLWFGTEKGVCRYGFSSESDTVKTFSDMTEKLGVAKFNFNCIYEDKSGNMWIGSNGWGVNRYNPVSGEVTHFTKEDGLGSNAVQCILEDRSGNLWFGERAGGVSLFDTATGKIIKVNSDGCFSTQIMDIVEDNSGKLWFANLYSGVCRYDPSAKTYTHFTTAEGFCNDTVTLIYKDLKGNIWFGCGSSKWNAGVGGLCRYNENAELRPNGIPFSGFGKLGGDASTDVWTIVEENDGTMWVGTRGGLWRYHSPSGKFIEYTHKVNSN